MKPGSLAAADGHPEPAPIPAERVGEELAPSAQVDDLSEYRLVSAHRPEPDFLTRDGQDHLPVGTEGGSRDTARQPERLAVEIATSGVPEAGVSVGAGCQDEVPVGAPGGCHNPTLVLQQCPERVELRLPARQVGTDGPAQIRIVLRDQAQALGQPEQASTNVALIAVAQRAVTKQAGRDPLVKQSFLRFALPSLIGRESLQLLGRLSRLSASLSQSRLPSFPCDRGEGGNGTHSADHQQRCDSRTALRPLDDPTPRADLTREDRFPCQEAGEIVRESLGGRIPLRGILFETFEVTS